MSFDTLLIANRGEIAVRVARTARRMGLRTVAVHSDVDAHAPHVAACDLAVAIGPAPAPESYLRMDKVLDAARRTGAGAVHPGYGFLSENAAFAEACEQAGITWVGPPPRAITEMGDKASAKRLMRDAGVPVVPGYEGDDQSDERLLAEGTQIGFPLMVKAAAGGGGKGMRLVTEAAALPDALAAARRESMSAFGSDVLLLERAVVRPRHVEIQVLADSHGHCVHLNERDCSVQRRHQKVVEEAPSPAVDHELRARMGAAGVAAAQAVDYVGVGTIEFLLDESGAFFFLEMNTRLQVEHPVTEAITGLDLVEWQLRVARGEHLAFGQEDVRLDGHAIEVRLYAEDPARGYLPATGVLRRWRTPTDEGVRVDAGVTEGSEITPHYDPMIAKVIAHGVDREQARARLVQALQRTTALGTVTNRAMLIATLREPAFASGAVTTAFLEEHDPTPPVVGTTELAAIATARYTALRKDAAQTAHGIAGWSSSGELQARWRWRHGEQDHLIVLRESTEGVTVDVDGTTHQVQLSEARPEVDDAVIPIIVVPEGVRLHAAFGDLDVELLDVNLLPSGTGASAGAGVITAPMHGKVIAVAATVGDEVRAGQRLVVLEAMKMEHELVAEVDGVLEEIVALGAQVDANQAVARVSSETTGDDA
ncbi:MAG: ATP-grasp protein [Solirubrobacterales bacterium]|nr:ATP-grasp protein [Solirubrobacterales bacterium]